MTVLGAQSAPGEVDPALADAGETVHPACTPGVYGPGQWAAPDTPLSH